MKALLSALALCSTACFTLMAVPAHAADEPAAASCDAKATDKKLAGAAKTSFLKKCEKDAKLADASGVCDSKAAEKKLAGAAKNSFVKKCVADAAK
jgi:hypothetical protein